MQSDKRFRERTLRQLTIGELYAYQPIGTIDEFYFSRINLSTFELFTSDLASVSIEEVRMVFDSIDKQEASEFN